MDSADNELLQFDSLSPSGRYSELTQHCVGQLMQWLERMLEGEGIADDDVSAQSLLDRLEKNRQALRNGYRFQLQKLFSNFKAIRPTRLQAPLSGNRQAVAGIFETRNDRIRPTIGRIENRIMQELEPRLLMLDRRMKYLVHRSDDGLEDNPLRPASLCHAFVSAIEILDLPQARLLELLELYGRQLESRLPGFCRTCDKSLSELGVCFDLPFVENPTVMSSEADTETSAIDTDATAAAEPAGQPAPEATESIAETGSDTAPPADTGADIDTDPAVTANPPPEPVQPAAAETKEISEIDALPPDAANDTATDAAEAPPAVDPAAEADDPASERPPGLRPRNAAERIGRPIRETIDALKQLNEEPETTIAGFLACIDRLLPLVGEKQQNDLQKFAHFYAGLVENPHVSDPLRRQLLRLGAPLLYLVLSDPFFFRSSAHPVNDFLHSMIDFEIRHGHQPQNLKVLVLLVDNLLRLEMPVLSDFQPITQGYEVFKRLELERLEAEKKTREHDQQRLKKQLLEWIHELTDGIDLSRDALAFFYDDWQLYLLQVARQYGEDSNPLQDAKELARMLAWSLNPNRPENPHYASQRFTMLLREIDRALRSLDYPAQHRQRLRRILVRQFRQANRPTSIYAVQPVLAASPAVQPFFGRLGEKRPPWAAPPRNKQPELYPDIASLIQIGDWIEVKPQPGSGWRNPQRGKLRWQSTDGIYRFFNQRGSIILEIDADALNRLFARGEASLLKPFSSTGLGGSLGSGFRIYR